MEIRKIPAKVGWVSLIGTWGDFPIGWGNYFSFASGPRCLNMWAENLEEAVERFLPDGLVEIAFWPNEKVEGRPGALFGHALVVDERIPKDWLYQTLCFTGDQSPNKESAKEMYDLVGDLNFEYERFIDPASYYKKRGGTYKVYPDGMAIVSYGIKDQSTITSPYVPLTKR